MGETFVCVFESDCWTLSWGIKENMAEEHHELYTSTATLATVMIEL